MKTFLKLLALLPIPLVVLLVWKAGGRPVPPLPLTAQATQAGHGGLELPRKLKGGWVQQGKVQRYDKKTLFDRINGAAPAYIRAGFTYSLGLEYRGAKVKEPVVVDAYHMGTTAQALGMYATERDASYRFVKLGDDGYAASGSVNFWQGPFYVKLAGFEESTEDALVELARALASALPPAKPAEKKLIQKHLAWLPAGQTAHSQGYSHGPLGDIRGLEQAYFASYGAGEGRYRLFVVLNTGAAQRFGQVKAYFAKDQGKLTEQRHETVNEILARVDDLFTLALFRGQTLAGAVDLQPAQLPAARAELLKSFTREKK